MYIESPESVTRTASRSFSFNGVYVVIVIALLDLAALGGTFALSYFQAETVPPDAARVWRMTDAVFCVSLLYLMLAAGCYRTANLGNVFSQITLILLNGLMIASLEWLVLWALELEDDFAWPWNGPLNLLSLGTWAMCASRILIYRVLVFAAERGLIARNVAIVGAGSQGQRLIAVLRQRREPWVRIIGLFDDRKERLQEAVGDLEINGTVGDLINFARDNRVDEILVALPWNAEKRLLTILGELKVIPAYVRMAPDSIGHRFLDTGFGVVNGVPVYNIYRKPISEWGALLKRIEDLVFGGILLVCVSPVMVLCAIAIKLDSRGPVFFRQNRYGYNNSLIGVYKFRSMYHETRDENCDRQTTRGDPRITRVGAFLRRTSLDELPQLINVMTGEMSLVGPRPHAINTRAAGKLFEEVVREYAVRHKVKPGITGWAQVMGWRGETDTEEKIRRRVECDLYYMEHWTLFLDIEILFRTLLVVAGRDVY